MIKKIILVFGFIFIFIFNNYFSLLPTYASFNSNISKIVIKEHNKYREELYDINKFPLVWDVGLEKDAQDWANYLANNYILGEDGTWKSPHSMFFNKGKHHFNKNQGENIGWGRPARSIKDTIISWGNEKKFYNYKTNSCQGGQCGHYTQMIWANTNKVGCASANSITNLKGNWVVCRYAPFGNIVGKKPYIININSNINIINKNKKIEIKKKNDIIGDTPNKKKKNISNYTSIKNNNNKYKEKNKIFLEKIKKKNDKISKIRSKVKNFIHLKRNKVIVTNKTEFILLKIINKKSISQLEDILDKSNQFLQKSKKIKLNNKVIQLQIIIIYALEQRINSSF